MNFLIIALFIACTLLAVFLSPIFIVFAVFPLGYLINTEYEKRLEFNKAIEKQNDLDNLNDPRV